MLKRVLKLANSPFVEDNDDDDDCSALAPFNRIKEKRNQIPVPTLCDGDAQYLICLSNNNKTVWIRHVKKADEKRLRIQPMYNAHLIQIDDILNMPSAGKHCLIFACPAVTAKNLTYLRTEDFTRNLPKLHQIFATVLELHQQGIVHGNLSLENIFEESQGSSTWWLGDICRSSCPSNDTLDLAAILLEILLKQQIAKRTKSKLEKLCTKCEKEFPELKQFVQGSILLKKMVETVLVAKLKQVRRKVCNCIAFLTLLGFDIG